MISKILQFGFEIEGEFSTELDEKLESYGGVKTDGSVRSCKLGCDDLTPGEFASEALTNLSEAKKIFKIFQKHKYHWNNSAGFHIHVSFYPKLPQEIMSSCFINYFKKELYNSYPDVISLRGKNRYCRISKITDFDITYSEDRYRFINFMPALHKHGTIEFRIWPSGKPLKMYEYLCFTLEKIEFFIKNQDSLMKKRITIPLLDKKNVQTFSQEVKKDNKKDERIGIRAIYQENGVVTHDVII